MAEESELRQRSVQPTGPGPVLSQDREEEGGRNESTVFSKLFATMLVLPGIILYVYILYIVLANLLYPSSFAPFLPHRTPHNEENVTTAALDDEVLRRSILINAALLCLFVAQHSLMACRALKDLFNSWGLSALSRLVYIFATCCTIQFIYHFWQSTPSHTLWACHNCLLAYCLKAVHTICWMSMACSLFTIDYLELLGIKQLYYSYNGFENPIHYKSAEQQHLLSHMRHPLFTAPLIILWAVPVMPYDRLLVAVMLPLYMAWGSQINILDASYVKEQFMYKWQQLLLEVKQN